MDNIAVLIPNDENNAAKLFIKNEVPFLVVPINVTIFLSFGIIIISLCFFIFTFYFNNIRGNFEN